MTKNNTIKMLTILYLVFLPFFSVNAWSPNYPADVSYFGGPAAYTDNNYSYSYSQVASVAGAYPSLPSTGGGGKALANKLNESSTKTTLALITVSLVSLIGLLFFRKSPADQFDMKA